MRLTTKKCLSQEFTRVLAEIHPNLNSPYTIFAVFDDLTTASVFLGLVGKEDIFLHPNATFDQLVHIRKQITITVKTTASKALNIMTTQNINVLAVLNDDNELLGIIKQNDLLRALYKHDQRLLQQANLDNNDLTHQHNSLFANFKKAHNWISHARHRDFLTRFPNFAQINQKINQLLKTQSPQTKSAIFIINLDDFSNINSVLGHYFGNLLLQQVTERIAIELGPRDIFARRNGDEFVIILYDVESIERTTQIAQNLLTSLNKPFNLDNRTSYITASIGINIDPFSTKHTRDLLAHTKIALRHAKCMGKNNYQFFTQEMGSNARCMHNREKYLHEALRRNELSLCYQPIVDTHNACVIAMESLLRWDNPKLGEILPIDFIPLAEKTGLIIAIGDWVLRSSCAQAKRWQTPNKPVRICVNLSARQFQALYNKDDSHLIKTIEEALEESSLSPELLELEITESVMITNPSDSMNTIKKLKNLGVRIACDDFGIGYSSLNYLKYFPIDTIKIDKSFIDGVANNPVDIAIIRAIILIAKELKIDVIAEGVEFSNQISILSDIGCEIIQGYYFSKPVTPEKVDCILNNSRLGIKPFLF